MNDYLLEIFTNFIDNEKVLEINKYGGGHINDTYLVTTRKKKYILQKVNGKVFILPALINNYEQLIIAYNSKQSNVKYFPTMYRNKLGNIHLLDKTGNAWRVSEYLENSITFSIPPEVKVSATAGKAMGQFQNFLNTVDTTNFNDTIPDFHNPVSRFENFEIALKRSDKKTKLTAKNEIAVALDHKNIVNKISDVLAGGLLPVRITHNDPKLENILFNPSLSKAYIIDLDTIMKGTLVFDFGDMVRSITSLANEDEKNINNVRFHFNHFKALASSYFGELKPTMVDAERKNILNGIKSIIYIQGLRFLGDFLNGNKYYKVQYPEHNLVRCNTQFKLLSDILESENQIQQFLNSLFEN